MKEICCNECHHSIRPNLFNALRALRLAQSVRTLRVDALSANQSDNTEKSSQMPLMKDIYLGRQTVIWLGEETLLSTLALSLAPNLVAAHKQRAQTGDMRFYEMMYQSDWEKLGLPEPGSRDPQLLYHAWNELYLNAWFSRVWVIQE
jgi:Heterokaryon incompatibility protein (HET)